MKSIKQIAEEIANDAYKVNSNKSTIASAVEKALRDRDDRAAKIADAVEEEWLTNARNVARADDIVGGLAQSTYTSYAEVAGKIAAGIRKEDVSHDNKTT